MNVLNFSTIPGENPVARPPELKRIPFVYRGVWPDARAEVHFENPQLRANNLFVNHAFLAASLGLEEGTVNEVWSPNERDRAAIPDTVVWKLSRLHFERWGERPVLKCKSFFIPDPAADVCPEAAKGLATFVESFSDGENAMRYFFVGAFEGDVFPVRENHAVLSDSLDVNFPGGGTLSYFTSDTSHRVRVGSHAFPYVSRASDAHLGAVLSPEIPGLTDMSDCSAWNAGVPIDMQATRSSDIAYWERHRSKPKLYLEFAQAQRLFFPGRCTMLIFDRNTDTDVVQRRITEALRGDPRLYQVEDVVATLRGDIDNGVPFASLFLGLSFFIMVAALLVLAMLLALHLFDRSDEFRIIAANTGSARKATFFHLAEILLVLLPGLAAGLPAGTFLCLLQLFLLERIWNSIILMHRLEFHANITTYFIALGAAFCCAFFVVLFSLRFRTGVPRFYGARSRPIRSVFALGTRSFFRRRGEYALCMVLLVMGFLGTLGVGGFGIKNRGEDAFSYGYVAETALPVVPSPEHPLPQGGFAVRVKRIDSADCSSVLRAGTPTVYGCDVGRLTGNPHFLKRFCAAADSGSMRWIMKKRPGETISYPNGTVTLERALKASVFQRGILVDDATFATLFPEVQGYQFFLIPDDPRREAAYRHYLEPYGVVLVTTDAFMARAESFQNGYLAIFLQLGMLGFVLGIGSLLLLMQRNLHARRAEIVFLGDLGFSRASLMWSQCAENLWLYLASAVFSLSVLLALSLSAHIDFRVIFIGWVFLTGAGVVSIFVTIRAFFPVNFSRNSSSR